MIIEEVAFALVDALQAEGLDYLLVGALPSIHYGITRSTFDVDVVVELAGTTARQLAQRLGPGYRLEPQGSFEIFTAKNVNVIQVLNTPYTIDVFPLGNDPYDQERFRRRRKAHLRGREVFFPTPEDAIIQKLRWGREKDLLDTKDMLAVQGDALDWPYIYRWCDQHGTRETLERLRARFRRFELPADGRRYRSSVPSSLRANARGLAVSGAANLPLRDHSMRTRRLLGMAVRVGGAGIPRSGIGGPVGCVAVGDGAGAGVSGPA